MKYNNGFKNVPTTAKLLVGNWKMSPNIKNIYEDTDQNCGFTFYMLSRQASIKLY